MGLSHEDSPSKDIMVISLERKVLSAEVQEEKIKDMILGRWVFKNLYLFLKILVSNFWRNQVFLHSQHKYPSFVVLQE